MAQSKFGLMGHNPTGPIHNWSTYLIFVACKNNTDSKSRLLWWQRIELLLLESIAVVTITIDYLLPSHRNDVTKCVTLF